MLVKDRMSRPVITIHPSTPINEALKLMRLEKIRRLPVVDKKGRLIGIVSERDLLHASPSSATSLTIWEVNYLLSKIEVKSVMTKQVITISEETPLEDAAQIMADNKIGGLPSQATAKWSGSSPRPTCSRFFWRCLGRANLA